MKYIEARVSLESYQQELESLLRLVHMDCNANEENVQTILFTSSPAGNHLSPAELLRRGFMIEAYEAAKATYYSLYKKEPPELARSPKLLLKKNRNPGR